MVRLLLRFYLRASERVAFIGRSRWFWIGNNAGGRGGGSPCGFRLETRSSTDEGKLEHSGVMKAKRNKTIRILASNTQDFSMDMDSLAFEGSEHSAVIARTERADGMAVLRASRSKRILAGSCCVHVCFVYVRKQLRV
jgi:hypothetical protein